MTLKFSEECKQDKSAAHYRESMHHIRHLDVLTLDLPRTNYRTVGDRAFKVAAPTLWNVLPIELRIIKDITVFKRKLKTYYFEKAFD